jgi:hypothetical protein
MTTSQVLNNRVALKYNHILISGNGEINISGETFQHSRSLAQYEVSNYLNEGKFDNFVTVQIASESGSFGPDMKPFQKHINKMLRIIRNTNYKIVQQNGQTFTIEGVN